MKRLFAYLMVVVAFAAIMVGCAGDKNKGAKSDYTSAVSPKAAVVVRVDAYQVLQKSGLLENFLPQLKQLAESAEAPAPVLALFDDLNNSGLDLKSPVYAYFEPLSKNCFFTGIVVKMHNVAKFEALLDMFRAQQDIPVCTIDGCTFIGDHEGNAAMAYNNTAIMFGVVGQEDYEVANPLKAAPYVAESLNAAAASAPTATLPSYEGYDIAASLNFAPIVDMLKQMPELAMSLDEQSLQMVDECADMKMNLAFNFAAGSIDLDMNVEGMPNYGMEYKLQPCSLENMKYISAQAWAVANMPINGAVIVEALNKVVSSNSDLKETLNNILKKATKGNLNYATVKTFVEPLLCTVKGDVTAALNSLHITENNRYIYGEYGYETVVDTDVKADAVAVVNVVNDQIFEVASGYLPQMMKARKMGSKLYYMEAEGLPVFFGQQGSKLYLSTPDILELQGNSATNASWYSAVKDSYGFVVLNLDTILANSYISTKVNSEIENLGEPYSNWGYQIKNSLDYLLLNIPTPESFSLKLVLKNKRKNSLAQIVDIIDLRSIVARQMMGL